MAGRIAFSEIEVETQDGTGESLRRGIFQVRGGKAVLKLFETGMGFPQRREIPVTFSKPRTEFDFTAEHRNVDGDPEQSGLGTFTVREIDPSTPDVVKLILYLEKESRFGAAALQGQRKLAVTWSLVPPPRHESADA